MSSQWGVGNFIAVSGLAVRATTAYQDAPDGYGYISEEVTTLQILIDNVAQHFKSTPFNSDDRLDGQKVLRSCQRVLEDLNSLMDKYKRLASINERLALIGVKVGGENIITLRERLRSNTDSLHGFVRSYEYVETQAQLAAILGLHHARSKILVKSIASFAVTANINPQDAYRQFYQDLFQLGVTEYMIQQKKSEIQNLFRSQRMIASNQAGGSGRRSNILGSTPSSTYTTNVHWSRSEPRTRQSSIQLDSPLVGSGADPLPEEAICGDNSALLHLLVDNSHTGTVKLLFGNGAVIDQDSNTLLHCAARDGYTDTVKLLLSRGALIEAVNNENSTPLHLAAQSGHTGVVEVLLGKGASVEAQTQENNTPLHLAAQDGHTGLVEILLGKGSPIEAKNAQNSTPLHLAARDGHDGAVEVLLRNRAYVDALNRYNNTPLHPAASRGHTEVVRLLVEGGASIELIGQYGNTPLHFAASQGHTEIVGLLLNKGASIESVNRDNKTPLQLAEHDGHPAIVKLLNDKAATVVQDVRFQRERRRTLFGLDIFK